MKTVILLVSFFWFHNLYASEAKGKLKITDPDKVSVCQFYESNSNSNFCLSLRVSSEEFQEFINQNGVSNIEEIDPLTYGVRINRDFFVKKDKDNGSENLDVANNVDSLKARILRSISGDDVLLDVSYTDIYKGQGNSDHFPLLNDHNKHLQVEVSFKF
ncbi:MAG: hypothetical protein H6625_07765 [Bdellovibrionaceae bacterium]|nr:hypothetical protein [Pseudobdellovibrionaceae bacterium]